MNPIRLLGLLASTLTMPLLAQKAWYQVPTVHVPS